MARAEPDRRSIAFTTASVPENYQRRLAPVIFEPWAQVLLEAVGVGPGDHVLDVASGTGVVARGAAERAAADGRVVASDVSQAMLDYAATVPVSNDAAPIEYVRASADDLPFADGTFDVVTCQQGLQFFGEPGGAAHEMRRVLRPGASSDWLCGLIATASSLLMTTPRCSRPPAARRRSRGGLTTRRS